MYPISQHIFICNNGKPDDYLAEEFCKLHTLKSQWEITKSEANSWIIKVLTKKEISI